MARDSLLGRLKEIIADMVDNNNQIKALPSGNLGRMSLPSNRIKFLSDLIVLFRDTDIITEETKLYLFNRYMTKRGVNDLINRNRTSKKAIPFNTTSSKIQYDQVKLRQLFGENLIYDVLSKRKNIENYEGILNKLYLKYNESEEIRNKLILNIPKDCMQSELDDERFQEFIEVIAPYIKNQIKFIEENIDREACGYFNYIISSPNLKEEDKERLGRLKMLLGMIDGLEE